jgi:uncharacterized protein (TIGR03437 family)
MRTMEPEFFAWGERYVVAMHSDGTYALPEGTFPGMNTSPVRPGEIIVILGRDLRPIELRPSAPTLLSEGPNRINADFRLRLGGLPLRVLNAALAPGQDGVCEVTVVVPDAAGRGDLKLEGDVDGVVLPDNIFLAVTN